MRRIYVAEESKVHAIKYRVIFEVVQSPILRAINVVQELLEKIVVLFRWRVHDSRQHVHRESKVQSAVRVAIDYGPNNLQVACL